MDGNGRWALERGFPRVEGHRMGVEALRPLVEVCIEKGIKILSIFAFSSENWSRPAEEVAQLMSLFITVLHQEVDKLLEQGVRLFFTGERSRLPLALQTLIASVEANSVGYDRLTLNIVVNYGGHWDIVQAAKKLAEDVASGRLIPDDINDDTFEKKLSMYPLPHPDLMIRTGGECRLSNFFLWQLAYSELYFTQLHWPDFTRHEFEKALSSFAARQRRYGKISNQDQEEQHA